MRTYEGQFIGVIRSPYKELENMPIQPVASPEAEGEILVDEKYVDGLKDLGGFSHIYVVYYFHKATRTELQVIPYLDTVQRGVFATRSPLRPAHIGLSIVELLAVEGNRLRVRGIDMLDGTPLIDIKPYVPQFDCWDEATSGWVKPTRHDIERRRSDDRFA